jgi:signal transduction histidine kinase
MILTLNNSSESNLSADAKVMQSFIGMISHELRTQFAGIVQICQYIQEGKNIDLYQRALNVASHSTLHILDNMLTTVKINAGKLNIQATNETLRFSTWIKPLMYPIEAAGLIQRKDICLTIHPSLERADITTDKIKLAQILHNLLVNALKFSYAGTCIAVKCYIRETGLIVEIVNQGIGIPPNKMDSLFKPYERVYDGFAGTGLGLYLSQLYAETLGGVITVQSEEKAATAFTVYIPGCIHSMTVPHH